MMETLRLNIGCGSKRKEGWTNIDKYTSGGEDIVGDICSGLDLPDGCAREILLDNVIEHLDSIPDAMKELFRLLQTGGTIRIITPHFTSAASWQDPTHKHHLSFFSMDYFCSDKRNNYTGSFKFRMVVRKLSFGGNLLGLIGRALFALSAEKWEKRWSFMFRASTLTFVLTKD